MVAIDHHKMEAAMPSRTPILSMILPDTAYITVVGQEKGADYTRIANFG